MQYLLTFLEGIISFISPCMLPILPVYVSYFGGGGSEKKGVLAKAAGFVAGFALVFVLLGCFAGTLGRLLSGYKTAVNIVCGVIVIIFGLSYLGVIRIPFFRGADAAGRIDGVFSAVVFGMIYSVSLTPCVGAFLGSALMVASAAGSTLSGALLLLVYSLGLGLPFLISAVLIEKLGAVFGFIKRHYNVINPVCGCILIIVGILMICGVLSQVMQIFG